MKDQATSRKRTPLTRIAEPAVPKAEESRTASGRDRWTAVQRVRLPHKVGLPLSSGGCGDAIER
jgi:hypothetical protein